MLPEDQVGRLQVKSPTIMMGYYQNEEANEEVFAENGWFHTGDLGFIHEGRLVLTGREKDIIVINGANYLNYEIEAVVEEVEGLKSHLPLRTAFTIPNQVMTHSPSFCHGEGFDRGSNHNDSAD